MKKKNILIISIVFFILFLASLSCYIYNNLTDEKNVGNEEVTLKPLPKPEITGGSRGELGIDKNINETNIDEYLGRSDSIYRDMRMLEDPGNYENIGGDKFLSGYINGFEVIPLPYIIPVTNLPSEVGETYRGITLFHDDNGTYVANYEESMRIIEEIFPKDKVIFLMCGGGGYAGMTKNFLVSLGWDENKIYNVGGYWYYEGKNKIDVKKEINGKVTYEFDKVPYHQIEFQKLTKSANYRDPFVNVSQLKINTTVLELEEETSFQLNVIVLPNNATNKEVEWKSSNDRIAIVSNGLVKAISPGEATITAKSVDMERTVTCKVVVNKKDDRLHIKMSDISKELEEFSAINIDKIRDEAQSFYIKPEGGFKEEYLNENGDFNDLFFEESKRQDEIIENAFVSRAEIINKLMDEKKSFIVLYKNRFCDPVDNYVAYSDVKKILDENNYMYFSASDPDTGDLTIIKSKIYTDYNSFLGSAIIVQNGKFIATINPNVDNLNSYDDVKNWLGKYIDLK